MDSTSGITGIEQQEMKTMKNPGHPDFSEGFTCPLPITEYPRVLLAHGGGGKLSQHLIEKMYLPQFRNDYLGTLHDGAILPFGDFRLAFSTDSYVIRPIFFPGGDIGELAVNGTINDLAMCGARPQYLAAALILEEGFAMEDLWRVIVSMRNAAADAGVLLVTGDTKVVDRGKGDHIFITTTGIGIIDPAVDIRPQRAVSGDVVILSGPIAEHGIAIMSVREGLTFETQIESDTAALHGLVMSMFQEGQSLHVLRDPTRGGVASALNEIAKSAHVGIALQENAIPVSEEVRGACEILGLDPLYVANEGKLLAIVDESSAQTVLEIMQRHPLGCGAAIIGKVVADHPHMVVMTTSIGGTRVVDMQSGEQLPRIC